MGHQWPRLTRLVKFYILRPAPDDPIIVKRGCYAINVTPSV